MELAQRGGESTSSGAAMPAVKPSFAIQANALVRKNLRYQQKNW